MLESAQNATIILGPGFTGRRLARRLLKRGASVFAPVRGRERFRDLAADGLRLSDMDLNRPEVMHLPRRAIVAVFIPPLPDPVNAALHGTIQSIAPRRIVYVSSTGVYGDRVEVDARTQPAPNDQRSRVRLEEERWIASGPWSSLILRAAAIYGPGRGAHVAFRQGRMPHGGGSGIVSRIHVDDLAAIVEAGMFSNIQGAWPVADEAPCASSQIIRWYMDLQRLTAPPEGMAVQPPETGVQPAGRRVDGRKIREILNVRLRYPSWETGMPASLLEEESRCG
ncbi:MAG TPA: hypothetical protein VHC72_06760, partial [Bryobacteraceae bacterium]|nr:hypothetical protein [Bryobacteraceae bacterium]